MDLREDGLLGARVAAHRHDPVTGAAGRARRPLPRPRGPFGPAARVTAGRAA